MAGASIEDRVLALVADQAGWPPEAVRTDLELVKDLGLNGDAATTLIELMRQEFNIDMQAFRFERHFSSEGRPGWPWLVAAVVALPLSIALLLGIGILAALAGVQPGFMFGPGGLFSLAYLISFTTVALTTIVLPHVRDRNTIKTPLTVQHLINAAQSKTWSIEDQGNKKL